MRPRERRSRPDLVRVTVIEEQQGEDLDHNGALDGHVPVLYDMRSGRTQNLGIDGFVAGSFEGGLLLRARESIARRDWNGDGDREDLVLFSWDERSGRLMNTRMAPANAASLGKGLAILMMDEAALAKDLNGDGDSEDSVAHVLDIPTRRLTSLGLAVLYLLPSASDKLLLAVTESDQGQDLNGDGDLVDVVWHLTEVLSFARHPGPG